MKPSFVLNEEERKIRHEKRTIHKHYKKNSHGAMVGFGHVDEITKQEEHPSSSILISPDEIFTMDDMLFLKDRQEQLRNHVKEEMVTFLSLTDN